MSVMLATFMEVLDTSVANVALPHIAGRLGAGTNESTWVLTSHLVANAINRGPARAPQPELRAGVVLITAMGAVLYAPWRP